MTASVLELDDRASSVRSWVGSVWAARSVLARLARADFQVRYKRASLGVIWAVAVPVLQASLLVLVFRRLLGARETSFIVYVLSGIFAWSYFNQTTGAASTAIVDGSGMTDKIWFPRALLPLVPALANVVGLLVTMLFLILAVPLFGVPIGPRLLLLVPAIALLLVFTSALSLVLSALHVYFRDVRFLVQVGLMLLFFITPVAYRLSDVDDLRPALEANPLTGVIMLFRLATVGTDDAWVRPVAVSLGVTIVLLITAVEAHRRYDRLFVDLL